MQKPVEPTLEQFGLTEQRVDQLRHPPDVLTQLCKKITMPFNSFLKRLFSNNIVKALAYIAIGLSATWIIVEYSFSMLIFGGILTIFWLGGIFFGTLFVFIVILEPIAKAIWKHRQPDLHLYNDYQGACYRYKKEYEKWERLQPEWWLAKSISYKRYFRYLIANELKAVGYNVVIGRQKSGYSIKAVKDKRTTLIKVSTAKNPIGAKPIIEFLEVVKLRNADEGWFLSMSGFTENVYSENSSLVKPLEIQDLINTIYHPST